jgi:hypothetical protein
MVGLQSTTTTSQVNSNLGSRRTLDLDSHQGHTYYGPEVEMVIKRYISLRKLEDTPALDKFIKEQQAAAKMMMRVSFRLSNISACILCWV